MIHHSIVLDGNIFALYCNGCKLFPSVQFGTLVGDSYRSLMICFPTLILCIWVHSDRAF